MILKITKLLIPLLFCNFSYGKSAVEYLNEAKIKTSQGKYYDALEAYGKALEEEPNNYLIYIKRAFSYLNMNKNEAAINDFSSVIKLKPDFTQAYVHRAKAYLKECNLDKAEQDLNTAISKNNNEENKALLDDILRAKISRDIYPDMLKNKKYPETIEQLNTIIKVCPQTLPLRIDRAEALMSSGQTEQAMGDLLRATKLQPDNTKVLLQLSKLHLNMGEIDQALSDVKECLHRDPENKECKGIFRNVKKLSRKQKTILDADQEGNWNTIIEMIDSQRGGTYFQDIEKLGADNLRQQVRNIMCKAYIQEKKPEEGIKWCGMAIDMDSQNLNNYLNRSEAYILKEDYDNALRDINKAREISPQNPQVMEKLQKVQRLQKQASRKNYYDILGVPKTAQKREIKKAYRKLAQIYHPDKYEGDMTKEQVQAKMSEINEAYEILSNEELRERYDNGEDPNDPNGGQGGNPFGQQFQGFQFPNGFPFGNGNFQFQFKFN